MSEFKFDTNTRISNLKMLKDTMCYKSSLGIEDKTWKNWAKNIDDLITDKNNNLPFFFASENIYEKYVKQEKGKINQNSPILNTRKIFEDKIKNEVLGESIRARKYPSDVISCFLNE